MIYKSKGVGMKRGSRRCRAGKKAGPTYERKRDKRKGTKKKEVVRAQHDKPASGKTRCGCALLYWYTYYKVYYLRSIGRVTAV